MTNHESQKRRFTDSARFSPVKAIRRTVWRIIFLGALIPLVLGEVRSNAASVLAIAVSSGPAAAREILSISADGIREIAELKGQVLYGTDRETAAFLQTPADGQKKSSRLLIINRKTSAIVTDKTVDGLNPVMMKALDVNRLAVRTRTSTVYVPLMELPIVSVTEANWETGATRRIPVPSAPEAGPYLTALYDVPSGVAIEREGRLDVVDPEKESPVLALKGDVGANGRSSSRYYSVPGFGVVKSASGMFSRVTEKDFLTLVQNPEEFPTQDQNREIHSPRLGWIIEDKPCLIWGENEAGVTSPNRTISRIAIFDLQSRKIMLRKSLGDNFRPDLLPDAAGENIYFLDLKEEEIFCLNVKSQKISSFAKVEARRLQSLVAGN
jgi:hypothetical protein